MFDNLDTMKASLLYHEPFDVRMHSLRASL